MKCDGLNDAREQRGKAIASQGNQIKKVNDHSFKVKSQSGSKVGWDGSKRINFGENSCTHLLATPLKSEAT